MPWTIEMFDMWYVPKVSSWEPWDHWWRHWIPTFSRVARPPLGRNLPSSSVSLGNSLPPLQQPKVGAQTLRIHFIAGRKFCFTAFTAFQDTKSREKSALSFWALLDGEVLVMNWRRLPLTTSAMVRHHQCKCREAPHQCNSAAHCAVVHCAIAVRLTVHCNNSNWWLMHQ